MWISRSVLQQMVKVPNRKDIRLTGGMHLERGVLVVTDCKTCVRAQVQSTDRIEEKAAMTVQLPWAIPPAEKKKGERPKQAMVLALVGGLSLVGQGPAKVWCKPRSPLTPERAEAYPGTDSMVPEGKKPRMTVRMDPRRLRRALEVLEAAGSMAIIDLWGPYNVVRLRTDPGLPWVEVFVMPMRSAEDPDRG